MARICAFLLIRLGTVDINYSFFLPNAISAMPLEDNRRKSGKIFLIIIDQAIFFKTHLSLPFILSVSDGGRGTISSAIQIQLTPKPESLRKRQGNADP